MKKLVNVSLFIFFAAIAAIFIVGFRFDGGNDLIDSNGPTTSIAPMASLLPSNSNPIVLDTTEISKHNQKNDCWMIINGKIYNLTSYFGQHPGGNGQILPYCGKDGTQAYANIGHSNYANNLLSSYFIGDLNQSINQQSTQQNVQNSISGTSLIKKSKPEEEDD